jgi:hypothetical protein
MLNSGSSCREFLRNNRESNPTDQQLYMSQKLSRILTLYLPQPGSKLGDELAIRLDPDTAMWSISQKELGMLALYRASRHIWIT